MAFESVNKIAEADFPTRWGTFRILGFEGLPASPRSCKEGAGNGEVEGLVALVMGDIHAAPPLVRIHSQCLTGDVFGSLRCDCRLQLEMALTRIAEAGAGILLYEQQEGRGIGLMAKLKAYELQDQGLDTVEANVVLGYATDCRGYELPAEVLKLLGASRVRLITNNPEKVARSSRLASKSLSASPPKSNLKRPLSVTCAPSRKKWATSLKTSQACPTLNL